MTPPRRLPINVVLVRDERLDSYLARLAAANHLSLPEFRAHLGLPGARHGRVDVDRLSALTGHPAARLNEMVIGVALTPGRTRVSAMPTGRLACQWCCRSRGITGDVDQVRVDRRVCPRHRRWLGAAGDPPREQFDLAVQPEVVHAQHRHHRLLHRYGRDAGRKSMFWAGGIVDSWTKRGDWDRHRRRRQDCFLAEFPDHADSTAALMPMLNYPETVTLAAILANDHWATLASSRRRADRNRFDAEIARRLQIDYHYRTLGEPLVTWQEAEAQARRRRQHQETPNAIGLDEVHLAGPTVIDDAYPTAMGYRRAEPTGT